VVRVAVVATIDAVVLDGFDAAGDGFALRPEITGSDQSCSTTTVVAAWSLLRH
jgi:hypothetical protein